MLRKTALSLRRGKPRPRAGMFPDKYRRVPNLLKPQQGGQQYFNDFLLRTANDNLEMQQQQHEGTRLHGAGGMIDPDEAMSTGLHPYLPQADLEDGMGRTTEERIQAELQEIVSKDGFVNQRAFNERQWYEQELSRQRDGATATASSSPDAVGEEEGRASSGMPERVLGEDYFRSKFGYSLTKETDEAEAVAGLTPYAQLDLWGEMPKYGRDFVFLYLVSRRRNTYAVAYDYEGRRLLNTYTAGNRGLKGGDRGFRGDGSTDNGHQVTSMYLNDLLPKIREARAEAGRPLRRGDKVDLVVRVMGFYSGRQGAVRAVQDRRDDFTVRYLEDITPFPLNGPKMPRGVFK